MSVQRVAVLGSTGLLGHHVARILAREAGATLLLAGRRESWPGTLPARATYVVLDVTDRRAVKETLTAAHPDVVVNCAAMSNVDACERDREGAWRTNVKAVETIVECCRKIDARLVHVSTDYVFDGRDGPYAEDNAPHPVNYYGRTKLASENVCRTGGARHAIVRTAVLYGAAPGARPTFVTHVVRALRAGEAMRVVTDQWNNPTLADDVALGILRIIEREREGIFHVAGADTVSRYEFARAIATAFDLDPSRLDPCSSNDLGQVALRPARVGLITLKAQAVLGIRPSGIEEGLRLVRTSLERATVARAAASRLRG